MTANHSAAERKHTTKIERKQFRRFLDKMTNITVSDGSYNPPKAKKPSYLKYIDYI